MTPAAKTLKRKQNLINEFKLERGCENLDCSWQDEYDSWMLHLDHIIHEDKDPRLKKWGHSGLRNMSWKDLINELNKVQVLCANCHALKTKHEREE